MDARRHRVGDEVVGLGHRLEGVAVMPRLPAQRLLPALTQAAGTRRLAETVTGGRLAAVAAALGCLVVQPLEFSRLGRYRPGLPGNKVRLVPDGLGLLTQLVLQVPPDPQRYLKHQLGDTRPAAFLLVGRQHSHALVGVQDMSGWSGFEIYLQDFSFIQLKCQIYVRIWVSSLPLGSYNN